MNSAFDSKNRKQFDLLKKRYEDYLKLYAHFNKGSIEGSCTFEEFYWRFTYYDRYSDELALARSGY